MPHHMLSPAVGSHRQPFFGFSVLVCLFFLGGRGEEKYIFFLVRAQMITANGIAEGPVEKKVDVSAPRQLH